MLFKNKKIVIWMVVYDFDTDRVYYFNKFENVIAAIDGSIRSYFIDDSPQLEEVVSHCVQQIDELETSPYINIEFGNLKIVVYRWSLDSTNQIHMLLSECYDRIEDSNLRKRISQLFSDY